MRGVPILHAVEFTFAQSSSLTSSSRCAVPTVERSLASLRFLEGEKGVGKFLDRVQANMDVVLEQVCAELTNGGDHESRRYVAEQLIGAARQGAIAQSW